MWIFILQLSVELGTVVYLPSMVKRLDDIFTSRNISYFLVAFLQTKWSMSIFLYGWVEFAVLYSDE